MIPWLSEYVDRAGELLRLGQRRENATWLNVLRGKGAEIGEHTEGRGPGDFSMVMFLTSLSDVGGLLVIDGEEIAPVAGLCVSFPSSTPHRVTPLETDAERVSVGCLFHGLADYSRDEDARAHVAPHARP